MSDEDIPFVRDEDTTQVEVALATAAQATIEAVENARELMRSAFQPGLDPEEAGDPSFEDQAKALETVGPWLTGLMRYAVELEQRKASSAARAEKASKPSEDVTKRRPARGGGGRSRPTSAAQKDDSGADGDWKARRDELEQAIGEAEGLSGKDLWERADEVMHAAGVKGKGGLKFDSYWQRVVDAAAEENINVNADVG